MADPSMVPADDVEEALSELERICSRLEEITSQQRNALRVLDLRALEDLTEAKGREMIRLARVRARLDRRPPLLDAAHCQARLDGIRARLGVILLKHNALGPAQELLLQETREEMAVTARRRRSVRGYKAAARPRQGTFDMRW